MVMIPKTYPLLERCIMAGIEFGLNRAYKHTDNPTREMIADQIEQAIFHEIHEAFVIKEPEE